jgi:hypothetical protein
MQLIAPESASPEAVGTDSPRFAKGLKNRDFFSRIWLH